jgi:thiol-disulfide isomerase/thioredoxin
MKKLFLIIFFAVTINTFAQEIKPVKTTDDLESIMNSNKGKVILYNIWATWCKPCVQEFPELVKLYADYKDKGFELVFISVDSPEEMLDKVMPFLKKHNVNFTTYYIDFKTIDDFINYYDKQWEGAIPSTYIYDKDGKLVSKFLGNKDYDFFEKEIKKYLN